MVHRWKNPTVTKDDSIRRESLFFRAAVVESALPKFDVKDEEASVVEEPSFDDQRRKRQSMTPWVQEPELLVEETVRMLTGLQKEFVAEDNSNGKLLCEPRHHNEPALCPDAREMIASVLPE